MREKLPWLYREYLAYLKSNYQMLYHQKSSIKSKLMSKNDAITSNRNGGTSVLGVQMGVFGNHQSIKPKIKKIKKSREQAFLEPLGLWKGNQNQKSKI
jgi:hypothetical protein